MSKMKEIDAVVTELRGEMEKFYNKGNKAAATRARKHLQTLKTLATDARKEIQDKKNSM